MVGYTQVLPGEFSTAYESVIVFGEIKENLSDDECRHALHLLVNKYSLAFKEKGERTIEKSLHRTHVLRLDVHHVSGKCRKIK